MLFITNRALRQSSRSRANRSVDFDLDNNVAQQSLFFCRREGEGQYTEILSKPFLAALRESDAEQILIYIHGYSNLPEPHIFPRALALQQLFDTHQRGMALVVPIIWPCDNDASIVGDYYDDQIAADASGFAFARALEKFRAWQEEQREKEEGTCIKRINILAHSMGNRVLRETMRIWTGELLRDFPPLLFRNTFMLAADVVNESLHRHGDGETIAQASRNVVVYFASDDLALRASKVANVANRVASRRLGHTGPEDMSRVPANVHAVDCDDLNTKYDSPTGHSYFLYDEDGEKGGKAGKVLSHIAGCVETGRVPPGHDGSRLTILQAT